MSEPNPDDYSDEKNIEDTGMGPDEGEENAEV